MPTFCFSDLRLKEVVNVRTGSRLGRVCDMEMDLCTGQVLSIIVPGPPKLWGLVRNDEELVIPFCKINKIGEDVILIDINC